MIRGSPPRVRERLHLIPIAQYRLGITPACAGKTCQTPHTCECWGDHPRVCGKDLPTKKINSDLLGSPPRVRERRYTVQVTLRTTGITPACAGKTALFLLAGLCTEDHPRVCGKDRWFPAFQGQTVGSPPRVRERRGCPSRNFAPHRITPACAGKTRLFLACPASL